jgi:hypothetical protein
MDYVMKNDFAEMESFQGILFVVYLVLGLVSIVYEVFVFIYETFCLFRKRYNKEEVAMKDIKQKVNKYKYKAFNVKKYLSKQSSL